MAHRIFRLSISPDDAPEVRRVVDFDGRNTLHDVHEVMQETLNVGDDEHLYAFFLSGRYWDTASEYVDPRTDGRRADQALLFRLQLRAGQRFVYVYDYGDEHRYSLSVVSATATEAPLPAPVLVESVGDAPPTGFSFDEDDEDDEGDEGDEDDEDPRLEALGKLATAFVEQLAELDASGKDADTEQTRPLLRKLGEATLAFALALDGSAQQLSAVAREFEVELIGSLFGVPARLSAAGETELAVRTAEALKHYAPDAMQGEIALAYAQSGDRQRALELVLKNLETAARPYIAEYSAGYVYEQLGEDDAAEVYFRRALAVAQTDDERSEARLRITSHLIDSGRETEAAAFLAEQRASGANARANLPSVGRNDACPCGSGKKYKKCHGA